MQENRVAKKNLQKKIDEKIEINNNSKMKGDNENLLCVDDRE